MLTQEDTRTGKLTPTSTTKLAPTIIKEEDVQVAMGKIIEQILVAMVVDLNANFVVKS